MISFIMCIMMPQADCSVMTKVKTLHSCETIASSMKLDLDKIQDPHREIQIFCGEKKVQVVSANIVEGV